MQVNLRKANAIQAEIRKAINGIKLETDIQVSEFTDGVEEAILKGNRELNAAINRKLDLVNALYSIRSEVGQKNAEVGINSILAEVEATDACTAVHNVIAGLKPRKSQIEISARIQKHKDAPADTRSVLYGDRFSNVDTSVAFEGDIDAAKQSVKELKRSRQDLQDKLLQLNVNTLITLSEKTIQTLKEEGIL